MGVPSGAACPSDELLTLLGRSGAEKRDVVAGGDVARPELDVATDQIRPSAHAADAYRLAVGPAGLDDAEVGLVDLRRVHLPRDAQRDAQVVRSHEDDVDTVDC